MPYIARDINNKITGLWEYEQEPGQEFLPDNDPEIIAHNESFIIAEIRRKVIAELNYTEIHVSNDPPYPNDSQAWKDYRATLRADLQNLTVNYQLPSRPF